MANYRIKGLPKIKLTNLLKKRRTTLKEFLKNSGIASYQTLLSKCEKMGVESPSEVDFNLALGNVVSSPQEGLLVLDSPSLVKDSSGDQIQVEKFEIPEVIEETKLVIPAKKKLKSQDPEKTIKIDESGFVTSIEEVSLEKSPEAPEMGDELTVDDSIDNSVSKLTNLKKK